MCGLMSRHRNDIGKPWISGLLMSRHCRDMETEVLDVVTHHDVTTRPMTSSPDVTTLNLNVTTLPGRPSILESVDVTTLAIMSRH